LLEFAADQGIDCCLLQFGDQAEEIWDSVGKLSTNEVPSSLVSLLRSWLLESDSNKVTGLISTCQLLDVSLATIFDTLIGQVLYNIGDEWSRGVFEVGEEHRVSECVLDVLYFLYADIARRPRQEALGTAIVGSGPGEDHMTGALMVRIILEDLGWNVIYLGRNVPEVDFILFQRKYMAELVCLSVTSNREPAEVLRSIHAIRSLDSGDVPFQLAIGGSGAEGARTLLMRTMRPENNLSFFTSATSFCNWAMSIHEVKGIQ